MPNIVLPKRRYSSKRGVKVFSERSGQPFPLDEMVREPGTNLLVHKSESDGKWNITEAFKDSLVPPDAQQLEYVTSKPDVIDHTPEEISDYLFD